MTDPRRYDDEDIRAIIGRALENQGGQKGEVTHQELLSIGEQVGVSRGALEQAAAEVLESRLASTASERVKATRRRWLMLHAAVFAVINGLLFAVNALTTPGEWWVLFSVFFWGLALGAHAAFALGAGVSSRRQQRERKRIEGEARGAQRLRVASAASTEDDEPTVDEAAQRERSGSGSG